MTYFVVFSYAHRETIWHFADYGPARDHFDEVARELPPFGALVLYLADPRSRIVNGRCDRCDAPAGCQADQRCARFDPVEPGA